MTDESDRTARQTQAFDAIGRAAMGVRTLQATRHAVLDAAFALLGAHRAGLMAAPVTSDAAWSFHIVSQDGSITEQPEIPSPATLFGPGGLGDEGWVGEAWALGSIWPSRDGDAPLRAWPVVRDGAVTEVLVVQGVVGEPPHEPLLGELGRRLAEHAALALGNVLRLEELELIGTGALRAVARMVDAVSPWTMGRSERVAAWAVEIGRRLGLPHKDLRQLEIGGLVHDIGKLGLPPEIIDKAGTLTTAERDLIRSHPDRGVQRLAAIAGFQPILPMVRSHHELLDGSGYPLGMKGDEIPLLVRVLTVADVLDAMRSARAYRTGLDAEAIVKVLQSGAGTRFDARAVEITLAMIAEDWRPIVGPVEAGRGR